MPATRKPVDDSTPLASLPENPIFREYLRKGGKAASTQQEAPKDVRFTLYIPGPLCQHPYKRVFYDEVRWQWSRVRSMSWF
jgi:hypothetical protein